MKRLEVGPGLQWPTAPQQARSLIAGEWAAESTESSNVTSPYTGESLGQLHAVSSSDVDRAVDSALSASREWRAVPIKERAALLFELRKLLLRDVDRLSVSAALESGKTFAEARAEVLKAIEVVEFATSLENGDLGGAIEVSRGVSCEYRREPLGVVAGVTPFNFPAMVPMWMIPIAIALGNAFILKPSDKVPLTPCILGELIKEAGFPAGVFSILQGGRTVVEQLAIDARVQALGFVGSSSVAKSVYAQATGTGKRALCLGGAKNHLIVAPDADPSITIDGIVASFTGCAGQRCMAASVLVAVGDVDHIINGVIERASQIVLGRDMGALIDKAAVSRLTSAVDKAIRDGARVRLDGRSPKPPAGCEQGNWFGPTIIDDVRTPMECSCVELFGPALSVVRVRTIDEALKLERESLYGNALSVFTTSGHVARYVADRATSGMIGVNVGVPVPREPFSFGGTKDSKYGVGDITGWGGVELWSTRKKITTKWSIQNDKNWMS